jgi:hypothetical protein
MIGRRRAIKTAAEPSNTANNPSAAVTFSDPPVAGNPRVVVVDATSVTTIGAVVTAATDESVTTVVADEPDVVVVDSNVVVVDDNVVVVDGNVSVDGVQLG